jgi:phospholipase C
MGSPVTRRFRRLRVSVILLAMGVVLSGIGVQVAQAATASIHVTPGIAAPTNLITVKGSGFTAGELVDLYFDAVDVGVGSVGPTGTFKSTGVYVPTPAVPGKHWVTAIGRSSHSSSQVAFTVRTDWAQGGFDPTHQGWNITENIVRSDNVSTLQQTWVGPTAGKTQGHQTLPPSLDSSPAVVGGVAYVGAANGGLYAFSAVGCGSSSCPALWQGVTGDSIVSSPAVSGGVVYVGSTDGKLYAFNAKGCGSATCSPLWTGATGGAIESSPTVAGGRVYIGSDDAKVYAFSAAGCASTCSPEWTFATGGDVVSSPSLGYVQALDKTVLFFGSKDGKLYALDSATGNPVWPALSTAGAITSSPAFAPDVTKNTEMVYVGSGSKLYGVMAGTGTVVWTGQTGGPVDASPAVAGATVFVGSGDGLLYAYQASNCRGSATCSPIWTGGTTSMPAVNGSPVAADGVVYVGRDNGTIYAYNQPGCQSHTCPNALWSASTGGPITVGAAVANGALFVSSEDGSLHRYGLPSPPTPPSAPSIGSLHHGASPIEHVVVIFQENHSFDNELGKLCSEVDAGHIVRAGLNMGCDGATQGYRYNDPTPFPLTKAPDIVPGVNHSSAAIKTTINNGRMDGFSQITGCTQKANYRCYTQYYPSQIPNMASLAKRFVISDRTFATDSAATWGSHINMAAATMSGFLGDIPAPTSDYPAGPGWGCDSLLSTAFMSGGVRTEIPSCFPKQDGSGPYKPSPAPWVPTIMDNLDEAGLGWRVYQGAALWSNQNVWSMCPSFASCLYSAQAANLKPASRLITDAQNGTLPNVAYAMPFPGVGVHGSTSQHNGTSMTLGDNQIGADLAALMRGPEWSSTAVFITYDECGCFYDHVNPLQYDPGYGVRLPMVIVSPYARAGYTDSHQADITSISAFIESTFGVPPVSTKDAQAYDYANSFDYNQTPLTPVKMTSRTIPPREIRWLKRHPEDSNDPT